MPPPPTARPLPLNALLWEAHNNLGMLLHDRKSFDGAVTEYVEAKRLAPEESVVRNNLGDTFCDKGDYDNAITEFHELFRMDSSWQTGHSCLARALMSKAGLRIRHRGTQTRHFAESHESRRAPLHGSGPASSAPPGRSRPRASPGGSVGAGFTLGPSLSRLRSFQ